MEVRAARGLKKNSEKGATLLDIILAVGLILLVAFAALPNLSEAIHITSCGVFQGFNHRNPKFDSQGREWWDGHGCITVHNAPSVGFPSEYQFTIDGQRKN